MLWRYRGDTFEFADSETKLRRGDGIVLLTRSHQLQEVREHLSRQRSGEG